MGGGGLIPWCSLVCYEKLKSATIALIFPCHQYNAHEMWAKYKLAHNEHLRKEGL